MNGLNPHSDGAMTNPGHPVAPACLLCGSKNVSVCRSLTAGNILAGWSQDGLHFSPDSVRTLLDEGVIYLCECDECGFEFFNPKLVGGAEFYEQLHAHGPSYYAPDRPENERNACFAVQHGYHSILDVGCGVGFALDAAKRAGLKTYGLELSRSAAAAAAERGHTIFPVLLENLGPEWEGKFDLISLNQVLEHVPDPVDLVRQCVRFLSPRGAIAVAVPSATGVLRFAPWLPANWPPHHVSRWKIKNFYILAEKTHLRVLKTGGNRLLGSELRNILLGHRQLCQALQKPYRGLPPFLINGLSFSYQKTGMKYIFKAQGHSVYCYLGRP